MGEVRLRAPRRVRFDKWPEDALQHYAIAVAIGELSLGPAFDGALPWACLDNQGLRICWDEVRQGRPWHPDL